MESRYPICLGHRQSVSMLAACLVGSSKPAMLKTGSQPPNLYLQCKEFLLHQELLNCILRAAHCSALHDRLIYDMSPVGLSGHMMGLTCDASPPSCLLPQILAAEFMALFSD